MISQEDASQLEHIQRTVKGLLARCDTIELHDNWGRLDTLVDSSVSSEPYDATRLRLHVGRMDATSGLHALPERFPELRSLHIAADQFNALPFNTFAPFARLTSLSLCAQPGRYLPTLSVLADAHSADLVTLTIQVVGGMGLFGLGGEERAVFFPFKADYPYLRRLNIKPEDDVRPYEGQELLASITPERFPSLSILDCTSFAAAEDVKSCPPSFTALLDRPGFRLVFNPTPTSSRPSLVDYARPGAPTFDQDSVRRIEDGVFVDCDLDAEDEADFASGGQYCTELEETAEFLSRAVRHARTVGDTTALKRFAVAVKGLAMEKRLMDA